MAVRVVEPRGRGALLLDAHPAGCEATVAQAAAEIAAGAAPDDPAPTALIIGTSSGYGQAITTAGLVGMRVSGIGLCLERAATGRRTASAGWYRVRAMAALAQRRGARFEFHNGDCFRHRHQGKPLQLRCTDRTALAVERVSPGRTKPWGFSMVS